MTLDELRHLAPLARLSAGATDQAIDRAEAECRITFPSDYRQFLLNSDGLTGTVGSTCLALWSARELGELNKGYNLAEFCPEAVAIGSNGGGEAIVFRRDSLRIGHVPFIPLDIQHYEDLAGTFDEFLRAPAPRDWR
jgi:hypothetical protein